MNFLGVGPVELIFILIILILVFGPEDLAKAGKTIGRFLNRIVKSEGWRAVRDVSNELKDLPNKLAREADLDDTLKELSDKSFLNPEDKPKTKEKTDLPADPPKNEDIKAGLKAWTTPPDKQSPPSDASETDQNASN